MKKDEVVSLIVTAGMIYGLYWIGLLYTGFILLGLGGLVIGGFFHSLATCKGGGCVNGMMLIPGIVFVGIGFVCLAIHYIA